MIDLDQLERGDIVQHLHFGESYVVEHVTFIGGRKVVTAIRSIEVSNPHEWKLFSKSKPVKGESK